MNEGFPGDTVVKNVPTNAGDTGNRKRKRFRFNPWVRTFPWSRKWQPTPVFVPENFQGQRSLAGYSLWGSKESGTTEHTTARKNKPFNLS